MMSLLILLGGCAVEPLPKYWTDESQFPSIASVSPTVLTTFKGGQELIITGSGFEDIQTVVIGSRNAKIISATSSEITVTVPALPGGQKTSDISVVTSNGYARLDKGLRFDAFGTEWWERERGSFVAASLDCPVEAYATYEGEYYPLFWCGIEMGYSWALGNIGTQYQPGFAGDLTTLTQLSSLPEIGAAHYWSNDLPLQTPSRYGSYIKGDYLTLETPRDFSRDLSFIEERMALLDTYYYWTEYIESSDPSVVLLDDDFCYLLETTDITFAADGISLNNEDISAGASNIYGAWLGYDVVEVYEGESYVYQGHTATATVSVAGNKLLGNPSGATIPYSDYSGSFYADGIGGVLGVRDFPFDATYTVTLSGVGELGSVQSGAQFELTWPDLLGGQEQINKSEPYTFEWTPAPTQDPATLIVAEFRIYDMDIDDPNGWYEVGRLVKSTFDSAGELTFTRSELAQLPEVPNAIDFDDNQIGLWGEVTIARHHFQKVSVPEGEIVIDFVHAIQSPVDVVE